MMSRLQISIRKNKKKFISAHPDQNITATHHLRKGQGNLTQNLIPFSVPELIIDLFKLVKIHAAQGHGKTVASGAGKQGRNLFIKNPPVCQSRQAVLPNLIKKIFIIKSPLQGFTQNLQHIIKHFCFIRADLSMLTDEKKSAACFQGTNRPTMDKKLILIPAKTVVLFCRIVKCFFSNLNYPTPIRTVARTKHILSLTVYVIIADKIMLQKRRQPDRKCFYHAGQVKGAGQSGM